MSALWLLYQSRKYESHQSNPSRDLNLSKDSITCLQIKWEKIVNPGTHITFYPSRDKDLLAFFSAENNLAFYNDIAGLCWNTHQLRLYIDSSERILK